MDEHTKTDGADTLPPLNEGFTGKLARLVADTIDEACDRDPSLQPSEASKKLLSKRVSAASLARLLTLKSYSVVVQDELCTILDRILVYKYVNLYRRELRSADRELIGAWAIHSQSLRTGELYIVQDRTSAFLEFLETVGRDSGIIVSSQRSKFQKSFKKRFDRHLRERHRLVHAHEKPSLQSRLIGLAGKSVALPKEAIADMLSDVVAELLVSSGMFQDSTGNVKLDFPGIERIHEGGAIREAREMLQLVSEATLGTLRIETI